jgi:hypothetical protein
MVVQRLPAASAGHMTKPVLGDSRVASTMEHKCDDPFVRALDSLISMVAFLVAIANIQRRP